MILSGLSPGDFLQLCLQENERHLGVYDRRLPVHA